MALEGDTLATARVKLVADARGLPADVRNQTSKGLDQEAERAGSSFGKRMTVAIGAALAVGAAVVGKKLLTGLKESITAASDLNETTSKVSVVFGKGAKDIEKFAEAAATGLGQSKQEALNAAATFAVFGKGAQLTGKDLVRFSTGLTKTATDMASFSNTTPTEAIAAIGSALRGEFDPIERYGVLLNETNVKAEALSLGLLKGSVDQDKVRAAQLKAIVAQKRYNEAVKEHGKNSKEAQSANAALILANGRLKDTTAGATTELTAQQKVLAVQSLITKQTSDAQGDFARTSTGLANQQRILRAQFDNMKASIGQALLPVFLRLVTIMTTQVMPTLKELWDTHGPAVIKFLDDGAKKFGEFVASIDADKIKDWGQSIKETFASLKEQAGPALQTIRDNIGPAGDSIKTNLVPALKELKESGGQTLADTLNVTGTVMKFLADHTDLLAKALPILVGVLIAYKTAQLAANIAQAISPALRIAEVVATRQQTAAIVANTAARGTETATTGAATVGLVANTAAENGGILARGRAIAVSVAQKVATIATTAATWLATAATTALGVAIKFATGPIGIIITIIGILVAAVIYAYKHNETFRKVVDKVWAAIKAAIKVTVDWFVNVAWPFVKKIIDFMVAYYKFLFKIVKIVWNDINDVIRFVVGKITDYFNAVKKLVTVTIPNAFKTGVDAIGKFWDGLKELAKKPITFVVGIVNKLIGGYNKIAGVFKAPTAPLIPGFAAGGRIPGPASDEDNMLAAGPGGLMKVATGEFIVNARQTSQNLPLLQAINSADGFADGGLVGGILGFFKDPAKYIRGLAGNVSEVIDKFGDSGLSRTLVGMGKALIEAVVSKAKGLFGSGSGGSGAFGAWPSSPGASRGDSGIWRGIVGLINSTGPLSGSFGNAYRPGDPKWHGSGRAVDWMGYSQDALATFLSTRNPLELIHRTNKRDYAYTRGRNKGSFNNALMEAHRNHIHIAMRNGGLVGGIRSYDMGGYWPSGTLGINASGRTEHVTAAGDRDDQTALLARAVELLSALAPAVGDSVGRALLGTVPATRVAARQAGRRPALA